MTAFIRALEEADKQAALLSAARESPIADDRRFDVSAEEFAVVPASPFAYWISPLVRDIFARSRSAAEALETRRGMASLDDFRFVRAVWEVTAGSGNWKRYAVGGMGRSFFESASALVGWGSEGREVKSHVEAKVGSASRTIQAEDFYYRPGLTWVRRTSRLKMRCMPRGFIFSGGAQGAFSSDVHHDGKELLSTLALLNSAAFDSLLKVGVGQVTHSVQFEPGTLSRTPWPDAPLPQRLGELGHAGWRCLHGLDTVVEVSHAFVVPAVLQAEGASFGERVGGWAERVAGVEAELAAVQLEIDELCFGLYGISDEDRVAITSGFGVGDEDGSDDGGADDEDAVGVDLDPVGLGAGLVSWAVGVAVGRFDVRLATGEREWPVEPDPFDALPVCSAAMLTGDDGLPLSEPPAGYGLDPSQVLVTDPGHELDIEGRVRGVFDRVFGAEADGWWSDVGEALGARGGEVGGWLGKGFFDLHLKTHSKSRRKAPILWPIGTASGSYLVWLYAHRVTADSLFQVTNDLVVPKLQAEQRRLMELTQEAGPEPSASQRKTIDGQQLFVDELAELVDGLELVAPLWAPDLNDGIVIVLAPLWRLFAHHKPWSKDLKKHWGKLAAGEFDWAQLAMHLWPERVIPKCVEDRSLAIAHDLEDVFWVQDVDNDDKWHPRTTPTTPVEQLIAERHNPATKAALQQATP